MNVQKLSSDNNCRAWRVKKEEIYFNLGSNKRKNLLMIVSENKLIHYKFTDENTNEKNFLQFISEVNDKLKEYSDKKFIIIMDNLSSHRTSKLLEFYSKNNLNIIFNCVYRSSFNAIELAFRSIKLKIYKKLYENIENVINDVKNFILDENFEKALYKNYIETILIYKDFYDKNKYFNLNSI